MTVGQAVDAYRTLQGLRPQALSRALLDEVVDAAQALEDVATAHQERVEKHVERIGGDVDSMEDLTSEEQAELQEVVQDLRGEEADVEAPRIDPSKANTIAAMREIQEVEALGPLLSE
jgi:ABC-type transporter Mla subunit MlaD